MIVFNRNSNVLGFKMGMMLMGYMRGIVFSGQEDSVILPVIIGLCYINNLMNLYRLLKERDDRKEKKELEEREYRKV